MWLQRLKVGLWLMGNNDNLVVENNRILDTTADGLNLNGNACGVRVRNNFLRNNGDDTLAMWSLYAPDTDSSFENNTISQPNLANGTTITDSPYSAFEFVSGGGHGYATKNIAVDGATVRNTGTVVVQAESQGTARFSNVQATAVGAAGLYNCPYPTGSGAFTLTNGGGNSGHRIAGRRSPEA